MQRYITKDDIRDFYLKGKQRGLQFIISKLSFSKISRTKSAFNETAHLSSNWWNIKEVQKRWNKMITGNTNLYYEDFVMQAFLNKRKNIRLLSLGSGSCQHELKFAQFENFKMITCVDLSPFNTKTAKKIAKDNNLNNIEFICCNIADINFSCNHYDVILFNSSLHHFNNVDELLSGTIKKCLKDNGYLIINEYVGPNRFQFPNEQIKEVNEAIRLIPTYKRERFKSSSIKSDFSGSGVLRVIIADPSECVDSENIIPAIRKYFKTIYEKPYGGNILMNVLKDIAHNFKDEEEESIKILNDLFQFEDNYLNNHPSDFVFGIYSK